MTKNIAQEERRIINRRNALISMGLISATTVATQSHAAITSDQVKSQYDKTGAEGTIDGTGLIVIGLAVGTLVISYVIHLIKR